MQAEITIFLWFCGSCSSIVKSVDYCSSSGEPNYPTKYLCIILTKSAQFGSYKSSFQFILQFLNYLPHCRSSFRS